MYRIINVLELYDKVPNNLHSFIIYEEQESGEIIKEAEDMFIKLIEYYEDRELDEEEIEYYLDENFYENKERKIEYYIICSN